ncbi:hypothetical protein JJB09_13355 [Rhizobium sp. KVB221]|uniref:Uncharacterized protein n=1 Tax=Rhizobium setariae TaxID=2801340 RepID=A0A936YR33_9HYPH|nr:hypothetical protein [Rhizobium setariae]MBL0373016.1 hypothetical protein [Rhizobium setariae]
MKAAFIVMSILGCDDSGVQCLPVASVAEQWATIAACDAASEKQLEKFRNVNHPMVVAVCQTADTTALADSEADVAEANLDVSGNPTPPETAVGTADKHPGMTERAIALFVNAMPTRKGMKATISKPVHFVTDTYSWVARKIVD